MSTELIPYQDIERMGLAIAKSGLFGMKTPEAAVALMLVAQAQGRHPATVAMEYDIIQGKPAIKSQAALMRFQEAGGKIEYITRTDAEVSAKFTHDKGGSIVVTWNMERAKKMALDQKDNWKRQPMIMLQWRVVAEGVRACYPACLGGSYLVEEVQDFDDKPRTVREAVAEVVINATATAPEPAPEQPPVAGQTSLMPEQLADLRDKCKAANITKDQLLVFCRDQLSCGVYQETIETVLKEIKENPGRVRDNTPF